ncbi:MAG: hypothetical protein WCH10_06035 [bacterium]
MRKYYLSVVGLIVIPFFTVCSLAQQASIAHFISDDGKQLFEYEPIWNKLQAFYGHAMPPRVTIKFTNAGVSRFNPKRNQILIDRQWYRERGEKLINIVFSLGVVDSRCKARWEYLCL